MMSFGCNGHVGRCFARVSSRLKITGRGTARASQNPRDRGCGAGILACQFTGHPCPVFPVPTVPQRGTGGKDAAQTVRLEA